MNSLAVVNTEGLNFVEAVIFCGPVVFCFCEKDGLMTPANRNRNRSARAIKLICLILLNFSVFLLIRRAYRPFAARSLATASSRFVHPANQSARVGGHPSPEAGPLFAVHNMVRGLAPADREVEEGIGGGTCKWSANCTDTYNAGNDEFPQLLHAID